jgi:hypothetical protein
MRKAIVIVASVAAALAAAQAVAAGAPTMLHVSSNLPKAAKVSLDGGKLVSAPGQGSTNLAVTAGHHMLKVTTPTGVTYQAPLDLKAANLMTWHGKGYWCVNLLARSLDVYSTEDCEEEVGDAG